MVKYNQDKERECYIMENKIVEIWIRGKKLCETTEDNPALRDFERIVRKAGYLVGEKEEDGKIIKMI
jgi:hypothetical protein